MVQDPNNGVYIPKSEAIKKMVNGKEYYFSSEKSAEEYIRKNQPKTNWFQQAFKKALTFIPSFLSADIIIAKDIN